MKAISLSTEFFIHLKNQIRKPSWNKNQSAPNHASLPKKTAVSTTTLVLASLVLSAFIAVALSSSIDARVQNSGRITLVGLEGFGGDISSADGATSIQLGTISAGSSKEISFYLRSLSNVPVVLDLNAYNWQPENVAQFILVSWDYNGTQIAPNGEIPVTISVKTLASVPIYLISFSFSLTISAVES